MDGSKSGVDADITESRVRLQDIRQEQLLGASMAATPTTVHTFHSSCQQACGNIDSTYLFFPDAASLARVET